MKIIKEEKQLNFLYNPYLGNVKWLVESLNDDEPFSVAGTFNLQKGDIVNLDENTILFKIGKRIDDYYNISNRILGTNYNVFIYKDVDVDFKMIACSKNKNVFEFIDEVRETKDDIYIDGPKNTLSYDDFKNIIKQFPNSYEKELYNKARISQVLENYFDNINNYSKKLDSYREKKRYTKFSSKTLYTDYDIVRYERILAKLKKMLSEEEKYTENEWGKEIAQIILILFPKYINYHEQVKVMMSLKTSRKKTEKLDFMLVKSDGCIDVLEIKKANDICIISNSCDHDNHYATSSLSKVTMQLEKYLFNIIRDSLNFEKDINDNYAKYYENGFKIKVVNPKGIIIMGSSKDLNSKQLLDLEIIRKMYSNIVDIYTYDDIVKMLENIIYQIRKKV